MGIFELIIIIASAIIFIILIRRFPDTNESTPSKSRFSFNRPQFSFPSIKNPLRGRDSHKNGSTLLSDPTHPPLIQAPNQYEPGTSPKELEHLSPALKQLLSEAGNLYDSGDYDKAERLYLEAAAEDPKCTLAYNRLGLIYLKKKETLDDAEEALRQAHRYDPKNGFILDNLGLASFMKSMYNEAVNFFEQSIAADNTVAERHAHLGSTYLSMRQYAKAVRYLARAWALDPSNTEYKDLLDDAKERERRQRSIRH